MKKLLFTFILGLITSVSLFAKSQTDAEQIKTVINSSYIDGIQNWGDPATIRQGFIPEFVMLMLVDNKIQELPLETWIGNVKRQKAENPDGPPHTASVKYLDIDVIGTTAMVKLEIYRQGKKQFTDYLALYKFNDGWKIVGKTFYRH